MAEQEDDHGFVGRLTKVKVLQTILNAIVMKEDICSIFIKKDGLRVTVEDSKAFQANAFITANLFKEYKLVLNPEEELCLNTSLSTFIECLNLFGAASPTPNGGLGNTQTQTSSISSSTSLFSGAAVTNLVIHYERFGEPLEMWMEEDGVVSKAKIPSQECVDTLYFDFSKPNIMSKVVVISEYLRDIFAELDQSSEFLELSVSCEENTFTMATNGDCGDVAISIPDHSEIVHFFECKKNSKAKYRMSTLRMALKAITMSEKLSIRMDKREFVCFQYLLNFPEGNCFLEYYCAPEETEDD